MKQILSDPDVLDFDKLLHYDPETGIILWAQRSGRRSGRSLIGREAGRRGSDGYRAFHAGGRRLLSHRAAWRLFYGMWPDGEIDHINGIRDDNRIVNLRITNRAGNNRNRHKKTGKDQDLPVGVIRIQTKHGERYRVTCKADGKLRATTAKTIEAAAKKRRQFEIELWSVKDIQKI